MMFSELGSMGSWQAPPVGDVNDDECELGARIWTRGPKLSLLLIFSNTLTLERISVEL